MDGSDSGTGKAPRTVPRWWFLVVFAAALASQAYEWTCGACSTWPAELLTSVSQVGAFGFPQLSILLPNGDQPEWLRFVETMALGVVGVAFYWLLIRRFLAPRVRVWVFLLVLVGIPVMDFALALLFLTVGMDLHHRLLGL
ncbi:hypothetical protein [Phenylobacterium soli]|uniref:Uncharacterized protein n=1 Tax=Phenylobacterium soli TaxID=2170551 RepID=A0A328APU8_9CAUL|nr:hypothetical protein [Phenylobacterium soli]RAK54888.1 hypothetical protein DJ017_10295 [Phenylobacterium soli]